MNLLLPTVLGHYSALLNTKNILLSLLQYSWNFWMSCMGLYIQIYILVYRVLSSISIRYIFSRARVKHLSLFSTRTSPSAKCSVTCSSAIHPRIANTCCKPSWTKCSTYDGKLKSTSSSVPTILPSASADLPSNSSTNITLTFHKTVNHNPTILSGIVRNILHVEFSKFTLIKITNYVGYLLVLL